MSTGEQSELEFLENFLAERLWNNERCWLFTDLFNLIKKNIPGEEDAIGFDGIKKRLDDKLYTDVQLVLNDLTVMFEKFTKYKKFLKRQLRLSQIQELQVEFYPMYVFGHVKTARKSNVEEKMEDDDDEVNDGESDQLEDSVSSKENVVVNEEATDVANAVIEPSTSKAPIVDNLAVNSEVLQQYAIMAQPEASGATATAVNQDFKIPANMPPPAAGASGSKAAKKKKANPKPLTSLEMMQLSIDVHTLPTKMLAQIVEIIRTTESSFANTNAQDFEVSFGALEVPTLRKLQAFVASYYEAEEKKAQKVLKKVAKKGGETALKKELEKVLQEDREQTKEETKPTPKKCGKTVKGKVCGCGK